MKRRWKLVAGVSAAGALAGGAAAIAAGHGGHSAVAAGSAARSGTFAGAHLLGGAGIGLRGGPGDKLAAAASYLGVSTAQLMSDLQSGQTLAQIANATSGKSADGLIQALVAAQTEELDVAVTAGRLTQTQETTILADLKQHVTDLVNGMLPAHPGGPGLGHGGPGGPGGELAAAAAYLGLTTSQIRSDLEAGQTLAQIANATSGKSADGLIQALVAAQTKELDAAVTAGRLTQAQETMILADLKRHVTDLANGTRPAEPGGPWHQPPAGSGTASI